MEHNCPVGIVKYSSHAYSCLVIMAFRRNSFFNTVRDYSFVPLPQSLLRNKSKQVLDQG